MRKCVAKVELSFSGARHATLMLSWISAVRETSLHVYGSRGALSVERDSLSLRTNGKRHEREQFDLLVAD
jgi:hypothetical protein